MARLHLWPIYQREKHAAEYYLSIYRYVVALDVWSHFELPFIVTGSAIYIYGILCHALEYLNCSADYYFYLDGKKEFNFQLIPDNTTNYDYNQLLYSSSSIPHGSHEITLQVGRTGGSISLVLFDYLVYSMRVKSILGSLDLSNYWWAH